MSDTTYEVFQHYGTAAERALFVPNPAAGIKPIYIWFETDTGDTWLYDSSWHQIAGSGIGTLNVSAGTTSNNLSNLIFSNSNSVSFGLNGSTITASIAAPPGSFNVSAGTTSNNLTGAVFSNSNGVSFGLSGSTVTASINAGLTSQSNQAASAGNGSFAFQTISFSNANGVSFSTTAGSAIIASVSVPSGSINVSAGTTSNNLTALTFNNSNGISFGLDASTITVSYTVPTVPAQFSGGFSTAGNTSGNTGLVTGRLALVGGNNITLSGSTNAGSITITISAPNTVAGAVGSISAGTTRGTLGEVIFSNSNGISFGADGQTITASHNALTSQSNQALSGSNGSFTFQTATFGNLNGLSFYTSNGSVVGSYTVPAGGSSINISAGTTSNNLTALTFSNSNNVSFGLNGSTITATATVASTQGSIRISAGTTSVLSSGFTFSDSNRVSFGIDNGTVTAKHALNFSAGTTSNNISDQVVFSNLNGVSFGLNGSTITASVAAAAGGSINVSAGTTSNNLTNFVMSNSNNVSFGLNGSTITATATVASTQGSIRISAGTTSILSSMFTFSDSNNISFGINTNGVITGTATVASTQGSIRISAGTTSALSSGFTFSNSNNVSFGMNNGTVTATATFSQTNQTMGLYMSSNTTSSISSGTVDARSMTFRGMGIASLGYSNGEVIISVPAGGGGITNINLSAGTTSNNASNFTFSDANGISFGLNASTITASAYTVGTATTVYSVASANSVGTITRWAAEDHRHAGVGGIGISTSGNTSGTTGSVLGTYWIQGGNNITVSQITSNNGSHTLVISAGASGGGGSLNVSAGTTSQNLTNLVFFNSNSISFGLSGSTITASANTVGTATTYYDVASANSVGTVTRWAAEDHRHAGIGALGISTSGNTTGTTGSVQGTYWIQGGNNITVSQITSNNGSHTLVLSGATVPGGQYISSYENAVGFGTSTFTQSMSPGSVSMAVAFMLPVNISASFIRIPIILTTNSTTLSTAAASLSGSADAYSTFNAVVYSLGVGASSKSLQYVASGSVGWTMRNSVSAGADGSSVSYSQFLSMGQEGNQFTSSTQYTVNNTNMSFTTNQILTRVSGNRFLDINFNNSLSAGPYWLVFGMSSSSSSNSARISAATNCRMGYASHQVMGQWNIAFGVVGDANFTTGGLMGAGSFSTAGGGTTASIPIANITSSASNLRPYFQMLRSV